MRRKKNYLEKSKKILNSISFSTKIVLALIFMLFFLDIFDFKINLIILLFSLLIINILYYNQKIRMIEYNTTQSHNNNSNMVNNNDTVENFEFNVVENEKKYSETNPYCKPYSARINYHCKSKDTTNRVNYLNDQILKNLRSDLSSGDTSSMYFHENLKKKKYGNTNFYSKTANQTLLGGPNPKTLIPPIMAPRMTDLEYWRMNDELTPEIINDEKERYEFESGYDVTYQPHENYSAPPKSNLVPYKRRKKAKTNQPNYSFEKNVDGTYDSIENFPYETNNYYKKDLRDTEHLLFNKPFSNNVLFKNRYNPNLFTETITPGSYHINDRNEPINSMMGVSYPQQFEESNYEEIEPYEDVNVSNTYDPRFNGYGTSYRSYVDENLGQPRFYYDDVNAIKMPNYITRNAIDVTSFGDSYGPLKKHNPYTANIHKLADEDYTNSMITFRTEMQERLMRKRNAERWQQRQYPISRNGQRMLK